MSALKGASPQSSITISSELRLSSRVMAGDRLTLEADAVRHLVDAVRTGDPRHTPRAGNPGAARLARGPPGTGDCSTFPGPPGGSGGYASAAPLTRAVRSPAGSGGPGDAGPEPCGGDVH